MSISESISASAASERALVQAYLTQHKVNDMLCSMLESMCIERPPNPHQFLVDWMQKHYPASIRAASDKGIPRAPEIKTIADEDEDEAEDDHFETDETPADESSDMSMQMAMSLRNNTSRRRSAVSAESVDPAKIATMYQRTVHEKAPETRSWLKQKVRENFLFWTLDGEQLDIMLDAMFEKRVEAGSTIIKQGDEGDNFYILFSGECDVSIKKGDSERVVLHCVEGDSFGELALLYNAPRAATVKASTDSVLFAVDRGTFKFIMMATTMSKRQTYEGFLTKVPLLSSLTANERHTIADALKPVTFAQGETIIHQNDVGNTFFILEKGSVVCTAMVGGVVEEVGRCAPGEYFGEIALLTNRPRAATVTAVGEVTVLALDRRTFTRVLGPLTELLKRNMGMYNAYLAHKI